MTAATKKPSDAARRRDQRRKYNWLDQVKADKKLPSSAFVVAFELKQGFSAKYGGACWKSIETLADKTGLSEPSIVRITRQLVERGHLRIEPGKAGRGHSNRYFKVEKTSAGGAFKTSADGAFRSEKGSVKGSAGGVDSINKGEAKASPLGERERSHSLADIPGAPAPDGGAREREVIARDIFGTLLSIWDRGPHGPEDEPAAWQAFVAECCKDDPDDPNEAGAAILASAYRWLDAYREQPNMLKPLWKWLSLGTWKHPPDEKRKRGRSREPTPGEILLNSKYGRDG